MRIKLALLAIAGQLFSLLIPVPAQAATTCTTKSTNYGGYIYTAFKNAGIACTWDVPIGISAVDMLIVAGGGGGGPRHSGGGGAGGVIKANSISMTNISTLSITVGSGGTGASVVSGSTVEATSGSNSIVAKSAGTGSLATQTALGGGRGSQAAPQSGGSGGGSYSGSGASGTAGQGSAGATGGSSGGWYGGGGGGAGGAGTNGTSIGGGTGGAGVTWIAGFDATAATQLRLTNTSGYFGGGGGGGITASSGPVSGGAGGIGGGGNGGGDGDIYTCGRSGAAGCSGVANTGGGGGGAGLKQITGIDSPGGAGGSGVVIFRYTITDTIELSNYGPATSCIWSVGMNYAFLFNSGSGNAITKMRLQFEANALDSIFEATKMEIYSNNAGVTGSLIGILRPSALAAAVTAAGANVATRVGTYTGSVAVASATQYWFVIKSGGGNLSACQASGMLTQANSWSMVLTGGYYTMRVNGSYTTFPTMPIAEITTGTPDYLEPIITGPGSSTSSIVNTSIAENTTFANLYTANEWVTWSISGNDSGLFSLASDGTLTLTSKNFESPSDANVINVYEVLVTATDIGDNSTAQVLNLTINDVNEIPVISINSGAATHAFSVAENQISILTYLGSDPDTATTLGWYFADNSFDQSKFDINQNTGVLTFKVAPDYESPTDTNGDNVYKVNIGLFDGALMATQLLSVTVTNINEDSMINRPTFSGLIYKGTTTSISVVADTPGRVTFFVGGKRIAPCKSVATTGSASTHTAICTFKPAVQGLQSITARIAPSNAMSPSVSVPLVISVLRRNTLR
jgi:hypothetical protein